MTRILIIPFASLLLASCAPREKQHADADAQAQPAAQQQPAAADHGKTKKRDISTATLAALDPEIQRYADKADAALAACESAETDAGKTALVESYIAFGDYMTYESSVSPRQGKYHRALIEYRKALELDRGNSKVMTEIRQIEEIYRSMGKPVPGDDS